MYQSALGILQVKTKHQIYIPYSQIHGIPAYKFANSLFMPQLVIAIALRKREVGAVAVSRVQSLLFGTTCLTLPSSLNLALGTEA